MNNTTSSRPKRPICAGPAALLLQLSVCAAAAWIAPTSARAATLLSSPAMTGSFGPSAPATGFSDTGGGRVGGALQPLGSASVSSQPPAPSPVVQTSRPVSSEEPAQGGRTRRPPAEAPVRKKHAEPESNPPKTPSRTHERTEEHERETPAPAQPLVVSEGKEAKTEVMATTAQNPWHAELGMGYYSDYQSFRGVNILDVVTSEHGGSKGVVFSSVKLGYARKEDSLTFGFNYWQGLGRVYAKGPIYDVPPNSTRRDNENFRLPSRDRYAEYNLNLTYTRNFLDDKLVGSVGYNHFQFSNDNFWKSGNDAIAYANELMFGLAYTALPYIQPSLSYAIDFDGFKGSYLELRVDSAYEFYNHGSISARLRPYIALSYDFDYNGADNGWNAVEFGLNVPIRLNSFLTFTLTSNYVLPLSRSEGQPRASDGLWGGAKFTVDWGGPSPVSLPTTSKDKDAKIVMAEPGERPWEISAGAGWREINFSFDHRGAAAYPTADFYKVRSGGGGFGFASAGQRAGYDDGFVDSRVAGAGIAPFSIDNPNQVTGTKGNNAQVRFNTTTYKYDVEGRDFSAVYDDKDSVLSPYVKLDRELWRSGAWSLRGGLLYAFTGTSGDSGYRLARLDTVFEERARTGFVYAFDNINYAAAIASGTPAALVSNALVIDAAAYAGGVGTAVNPLLTPQRERTNTVGQVVSLGTFVRSTTDIDAHDLALPFSVRYDFANRIHAEVTLAPTVTLANASLKTDLEVRSFNDFAAPQVHVKNTVPALPNAVGSAGLAGAGGGAGGSVPLSGTPAPPAAPAPTPAPAANNPPQGGKGSTPQNPRYPGYLVAQTHTFDNSNAILFGVSAGVSVIVDLNQEQTFFAELYGKYHWIQDFTLNDGFGSSKVDLTSFQVGLGLGYRF